MATCWRCRRAVPIEYVPVAGRLPGTGGQLTLKGVPILSCPIHGRVAPGEIFEGEVTAAILAELPVLRKRFLGGLQCPRCGNRLPPGVARTDRQFDVTVRIRDQQPIAGHLGALAATCEKCGQAGLDPEIEQDLFWFGVDVLGGLYPLR